MIVVDTNIISEMMKNIPSKVVIDWIDKQEITELYITTITIAEISYGIHALPKGARRENLDEAFYKVIQEGFQHRILSFDENSAHLYGIIMSTRKSKGKPLGVPDGQIAAIARNHQASLATRNIRDFVNCGLKLINPF